VRVTRAPAEHGFRTIDELEMADHVQGDFRQVLRTTRRARRGGRLAPRPTAWYFTDFPALREETIRRQHYSTGTPWEPVVGYSRVVRAGRFVYVSGTTATDANGAVVGHGDPYRQAVQALDNLRRALAMAGAKLEHVVRTRIYVTDIAHWREVGRAHGEVFGGIRPATSMVEVSRLIVPEMVVEIEADAVLDE
jgi:enamine deaminase RidA (YjgF/YER057c/UK114 family)